MYFKQIELMGFKSFADRTMVRLEPGITGVVGPNGCGKSNILDSLRWALGEQSAKTLRGSHMQDVIFNGSENRQPMGLSEVSITFDNADSRLPVDFAEVQITRRLYRSGESEYLINKAPCRLRDIQELFMDTGIGTAAYSLIGQGKIDLVLSSKPEDRRFLFEEAAGIIKYKTRKRVAMRKLEGAEQNLLRLGDIIAEVQRQMRSLKRQVNAAIRYRELTESLRSLEIRYVWTRYTRLVLEAASLREKLGASQETYSQVLSETGQLEARNEALAVTRIEIERALLARRDGVHQIDTEMEKIEREIALLRQQIAFSKEQQEQALQEQEALRARATDLQSKMAQTNTVSEEARAEIDACTAAVEAKQAEYEAALQREADAQAKLEAVRAQSLEAMDSRAKTQTELETIAVSVRNIDAQLETLYDRGSVQRTRNDELAALLQNARQDEAEKQTALTALTSDRAKTAQEHADKSRDGRECNEEWQGLREKKSSMEARLHSLRELRDSYEGFALGVRAIMMAKQRNMPEARGVLGPVGDLLSTEKKYERAIEACLGGNIDNIVVEEADAAKSAIAFLKQNQAGRVTFLPLDTIRPSRNDDMDALKGHPGVIGPAINYVKFDSHITKAVEYLLFNAVLVETIDDAIRIARSERRYPRLVTLDGEVMSSAGALTGGRTKHDRGGLLGRSAEITSLENQVATADTKITELLARLQALGGEINALSQRLKDLELQERAANAACSEIGVVVARYSAELNSLTESSEQLEAQRMALETERERLESQRESVGARAEGLDQDETALKQALLEAQEASQSARQTLTERNTELNELRVRLAGLSQRLEEAARNRIREEQELAETIRNAERRSEQVAQLKENEASLENGIALQIERAKALSEDGSEARKKVVEAQNEQGVLLVEVEAVTKTLKELHEKTRVAQNDVHQYELSLRKDEDQIGFLEERILNEYHIALASLDADTVGTDEYDEETRETMVTDIREKIERMGTVNLMAIEEYEELEKRNEFLTTQEEDLRKAREALMGVVLRIDKTIRDMFLQTFERVADNFRAFFRRLFNGGQARIYLLDESDPLESGIEIEARPPGKKPQVISLLSGGEQAMTAISLLFAIFKAKPSPFCVLDEVDAPLDDANVGRFLDMVDEFTNESQFIIITHSKQTMARANVLYGVTMKERGVSQVVSVKFDESRLEPPQQRSIEELEEEEEELVEEALGEDSSADEVSPDEEPETEVMQAN